MWSRAIAISAGVAAMFALDRGFNLPWYLAAPAALLVYGLVRYIVWGIAQRRAMKATVDEALRRQNSN